MFGNPKVNRKSDTESNEGYDSHKEDAKADNYKERAVLVLFLYGFGHNFFAGNHHNFVGGVLSLLYSILEFALLKPVVALLAKIEDLALLAVPLAIGAGGKVFCVSFQKVAVLALRAALFIVEHVDLAA